MSVDITTAARRVTSRQELAGFVRLLATLARTDPGRFDNGDLAAYLEALSAWIDDLDGYRAQTGDVPTDAPNWRLVAQMLGAATVYE